MFNIILPRRIDEYRGFTCLADVTSERRETRKKNVSHRKKVLRADFSWPESPFSATLAPFFFFFPRPEIPAK